VSDSKSRVNTSTILEHYDALTPLGTLSQTADALMRGESAISPGPWCGLDIPCAPFQDPALRDLRNSMRALAPSANKANGEEMIMLYAAAKGDIRALDAENYDPATDVSPRLDQQALAAGRALGLAPARTLSISNACASGAIAVEVADELLRDHVCEQAVIVGFDCLSRFVISGFHALGALSSTAARPFDARRDGLSLGEAASVALLRRGEPQPGDLIIAGCGSSNDANHRTGPSRTGDGLEKAARAALAAARMAPETIDAVKCHGTATAFNDAMEAKAIERLFGAACPPCFSVKGAIGHASGGGSLAELLIAAECIRTQCIPPTAGYREHGVDEAIPITAAGRHDALRSILCLSAGFGGVNAAAVVRRADS
jgi:3-oxoacyl-[acyl-carrier-protein] synthase-1